MVGGPAQPAAIASTTKRLSAKSDPERLTITHLPIGQVDSLIPIVVAYFCSVKGSDIFAVETKVEKFGDRAILEV